MRVLARKKTSIHVLPGDTISLTYDDPVTGETRTAATHAVTQQMHVTEALVIEPDNNDCLQLGISGGIGGIFATRD